MGMGYGGGYGKGKGIPFTRSKGKGKGKDGGKKGGKGAITCYTCGGPHMQLDCTQNTHPNGKGKGRAQSPGKGKGDKGKGKGGNLNRQPNKSASIGTQEIVPMAQVASTTIQLTAEIG